MPYYDTEVTITSTLKIDLSEMMYHAEIDWDEFNEEDLKNPTIELDRDWEKKRPCCQGL